MDERLKVYEEKMTKSYDAMIREFTPSAQAVPIRMYWTS